MATGDISGSIPTPDSGAPVPAPEGAAAKEVVQKGGEFGHSFEASGQLGEKVSELAKPLFESLQKSAEEKLDEQFNKGSEQAARKGDKDADALHKAQTLSEAEDIIPLDLIKQQLGVKGSEDEVETDELDEEEEDEDEEEEVAS